MEDDGHWRRHYKHYVNTGFRSAEHDASKPWLGFNLTDEVPPDQGGHKYSSSPFLLLGLCDNQYYSGQN